MTKPQGEIWFLASCVELYKDAKNLTGWEAGTGTTTTASAFPSFAWSKITEPQS